jgi:cysteine synthase
MTSILDAIGNTPVVQLKNVVPANSANVYIKLEFYNPTGSYKDRMAKSMIEEAERRGSLRPGMTVVEATGGSTGSSLAFVCAAKGYRFRVLCSDAVAVEKLRSMTALGADLDITHSPSGKMTPDLLPAMNKRAAEIGSDDDHYYTSQFTNPDALLGYEGIGHELVEQVPAGIDAFCGAVGTAGMAMGVGRALRAKSRDTRIVILEPASAPLLTEGVTGTHSVEGTSPGFVPPHLDRDLYDEARAVEEDEARSMCRRLAREEGLLVGTSSGMNVVAALRLAAELGPGKTVVTVAVDSGFKYLNGSLFQDA